MWISSHPMLNCAYIYIHIKLIMVTLLEEVKSLLKASFTATWNCKQKLHLLLSVVGMTTNNTHTYSLNIFNSRFCLPLYWLLIIWVKSLFCLAWNSCMSTIYKVVEDRHNAADSHLHIKLAKLPKGFTTTNFVIQFYVLK